MTHTYIISILQAGTQTLRNCSSLMVRQLLAPNGSRLEILQVPHTTLYTNYNIWLLGSGTTFDSQSAYVLPYQLNDGSVLPIYMGDRWNYAGTLKYIEICYYNLICMIGPGGLLNATYIWLPVSVTADGSVPGGYQFKMPYNNKWSISQF